MHLRHLQVHWQQGSGQTLQILPSETICPSRCMTWALRSLVGNCTEYRQQQHVAQLPPQAGQSHCLVFTRRHGKHTCSSVPTPGPCSKDALCTTCHDIPVYEDLQDPPLPPALTSPPDISHRRFSGGQAQFLYLPSWVRPHH